MLVKDFIEGDIIQKHRGIIGIRKLLSDEDNPLINEVIDARILPYLMEISKQQEYPHMQLESIWSLTNLGSGSTEQCQLLVEEGAIPLSVQLLRGDNSIIVEKAIWLVGQIAADQPILRDLLIEEGAIGNLLSVLKGENGSKKSIISNACWALSNLCRGMPLPANDLVLPAVEYLCSVIS